MKKSLKAASQSYFESKSLSEEQFSALEDLMPSEEPVAKVIPSLSRRRWLIGAAMVGFSAGLGLFFYPQDQSPLSYQIAKEVAKNHINLKPLEVHSTNFEVVSRYFQLLDFAPLPSHYLQQFGYAMTGGRYCSIRSITAAQLRYQDSAGQPVSLFEVGYHPQHFGSLPDVGKNEVPLLHVVKGLTVQIWVERNVLMASVSQ